VSIANGMMVRGDAQLLEIVLENLLGNAWKFTGRQDAARIGIGTEVQGQDTVFFVRDNGAGFDMAYAQKLFSPFQRLHTEEQFQGTGIGLATVQRIVARHEGRIWATAAIGEGATFWFTLGVV
jgi:light-regulated signal transduction histidine kinase (bacteriophytochrome)